MFSSDGTLTIESGVRSKEFMALGQTIYRALLRARHNFTVRHRKEILVIPVGVLGPFALELMECAFSEEFVSPLDGDFVKHSLTHAKVMLL